MARHSQDHDDIDSNDVVDQAADHASTRALSGKSAASVLDGLDGPQSSEPSAEQGPDASRPDEPNPGAVSDDPEPIEPANSESERSAEPSDVAQDPSPEALSEASKSASKQTPVFDYDDGDDPGDFDELLGADGKPLSLQPPMAQSAELPGTNDDQNGLSTDEDDAGSVAATFQDDGLKDELGETSLGSPESETERSDVDQAGDLPSGNGLTMQPIPELQIGSAEGSTEPPDLPFSGNADLFDDDDDADFHDEEPDHDVPEPGTDGTNGLDMEGFDMDTLDLAPSDPSEDQAADDWHADLAGVLCGNGDQLVDGTDAFSDQDTSSHPEQEVSSALPFAPMPARRVPKRKTDQSPHRRLNGTAKKRPLAGKTMSALDFLNASLRSEQLPLAIIACVPRLRRFAMIQIGDPLIADLLLQATVEAAMDDPSSLEQHQDLGFALMALLYQQRLTMIDDPRAPQASQESARAFEADICRGLAGADQFEIHTFAQAINGLVERDRGLLVMLALENFSYEQIAAILNVAREEVMARVVVARMRLRKALTPDKAAAGAKSSETSKPRAEEIEINGYLDGELSGRRMADVDALVEHDDDAADRLLHYGIQGDLIRRIYAPLINRPLPDKLLENLSGVVTSTGRGFRLGKRRTLIAAAVLLALAGGLAWVFLAPTLDRLIPNATASLSAKP